MANSCEMKFQDTIFKGRTLTSVIVIADAKKCEIIPPLKIVLRLKQFCWIYVHNPSNTVYVVSSYKNPKGVLNLERNPSNVAKKVHDFFTGHIFKKNCFFLYVKYCVAYHFVGFTLINFLSGCMLVVTPELLYENVHAIHDEDVSVDDMCDDNPTGQQTSMIIWSLVF